MSQEEIFKTLEKHGKLTTKEIQEITGLSASTVYFGLKRLDNRNEIKRDTSKIEIYYMIKNGKEEEKGKISMDDMETLKGIKNHKRMNMIWRSYRICSCGVKINSRGAISHHRKLGHEVPLKRYKGGDLDGC